MEARAGSGLTAVTTSRIVHGGGLRYEFRPRFENLAKIPRQFRGCYGQRARRQSLLFEWIKNTLPVIKLPMTDDWISLKDAASLLRCHTETLRKRGADGGWLNYPELGRIQPGGEHSKIWLFKSEIFALIERLEMEAKAQAAPRPIQEVAAELKLPPETIDRFRRKGYHKALKAIGVKV